MRRILLARLPCLLALASLPGCNAYGTRVSLSEPEAARLKSAKIWVTAHFPFKQFVMTESLQRWYGRAAQANVFSVEGIWDPAPTLETSLVSGIRRRYGIEVVPLRSVVEQDAFEKAMAQTDAKFLQEFEAKTWKTWMETTADAAAWEARKRGGDYLLETWFRLELVRASPFNGTHFILYSWSRLLRLETNAVVWCKPGMLSGVGPEVEDFRDYARGDLRLFKEAFEKAAVSFVEPLPAEPFGDLFPLR